MDKPLSLRRLDFAQALAQVINGAQLPACIVLDVLQITTAQVSQLAEQQLEADRDLWQKAVLQEVNKEEEE